MSLLLQALQKAAKNREEAEGGADSEPTAGDQLALEPIASEPVLRDELPSHSPTPAQAATVVQASRLPAFDPVGYERDHYMIVVIGAALRVAIFYGGYVYIQVSNPAMLRATPAPMTAPLASAPAPAAPVAAAGAADNAAKISGMPADTATAAAPSAELASSLFSDAPATARPSRRTDLRGRQRRAHAVAPSQWRQRWRRKKRSSPWPIRRSKPW
jgi:hypothetical protein